MTTHPILLPPFRLKICGLTDATEALACVAAGAEALGVVFYPRSPRHQTPEQAGALARAVRVALGPAANVPLVAVTVNADDALLDAIQEHLRPDCWQLHGDEDAGRVAAVRARYGAPILRAFAIGAVADVRALATHPAALAADALLLDAKPALPPTATADALPGGNGVSFPWHWLAGAALPRPWVLSGGLTPANAAQALHESGALALDVSSGVEYAPGRKDPALVQALARHLPAAKNAD